ALEAGAQDVETQEDGSIEVLTSFEDYLNVKDAMTAAGFAPESAEVMQRAATMAEIADVDQATSLMKMIDRLEDLDDVQSVHTNADISDEIAEALG
ncbi:MAG: YebC/PmpR family DNA-binding transcriptional regulator, partial [Gammaproteobacteria bacterium]